MMESVARKLKWWVLGVWWRIRSVNPPVVARRVPLDPSARRISTAPVCETEYPYRPGYALVVRLHGARGVLLGLVNPFCSRDDQDIDNRLLVALMSTAGTPAYQAEVWRTRASRIIFGHVADQEEAEMFSDMLGLDDDRTMVLHDVSPDDAARLARDFNAEGPDVP